MVYFGSYQQEDQNNKTCAENFVSAACTGKVILYSNKLKRDQLR